MDVSKLKNDNTPIIIEAAIPTIKGSNFFCIFIYISKLSYIHNELKIIQLLKKLPSKLNSFYKRKSKSE